MPKGLSPLALPRVSVTALATKGFLPRELPPCFSSLSFGRAVRDGLAPHKDNKKENWCEAGRYSLGRPGSLRRTLHLVNPEAHLRVSASLAMAWPQIRSRVYASGFSLSRPRVTETRPRAIIARYAKGQSRAFRARRHKGARFLVRTDVNAFYPSVYTHSFAWAVHGKRAAKAQMGKTNADQVDHAVRAAQEGQSVGIPIGPDTSLVIGESILTAVDLMLLRDFPELEKRGFRYLDDYEVGFDRVTEAEDFLACLQGVLAVFQLALNPSKTAVVESPYERHPRWVREMSMAAPDEALSSRAFVLAAERLVDCAFENASENPQDAVLRYALRILLGRSVEGHSWKRYEGLILSCASADPGSTLPLVDAILTQQLAAGRTVSRAGLESILDPIVREHARLAHGHEVAWALWIALRFQVRLPSDLGAILEDSEDDCVALLAMELERTGLIERGSIRVTAWSRAAAESDSPRGRRWLLAYESLRHGFLPSKPMRNDAFFAQMRRMGVSFFDPRVRPTEPTGAALPVPGGTRDLDYF